MKGKKRLNEKFKFRDTYVSKHQRSAILLINFLVLFFISISAFGQKVTLSENNAKMSDVLEKLRQQTQCDLVGELTLLQKTTAVTIKVSNMDIQKVLLELEKDQPLKFIFKNNTIIVQPKRRENEGKTKEVSQQGEEQDFYRLQGKVTDEKGKPIGGVNIQVLETGHALGYTLPNGTYTVFVKEDDFIRFSMMGYGSQHVEVKGRKQIHVRMNSTKTEIEETVVTGYTKTRREAFTGAATTITRKELEKFNSGNIFSLLQALDPSFKVDERVQAGSNPNALPEINIRGISSVGNHVVNTPLVILDGFEVPLAALYDLDVNRVESISILKDASSTSLYGSRGGNGVIVIETRLPKDGRFTITYDLRPASSIVDLSDYNLMNSAQKLEYEKLAGIYKATNMDDPNWAHMEQEIFNNLYNKRLQDVKSGVDTYWLKQPVRNTYSLGHSLRMEGGGEEVRYSLEGNFSDYKGVMKESGRTRGGAAFNLIYRIPNVITFRNVASYQYTKAYNSPYGEFSYYTLLNPYERIFDQNGKYIVRFGELGQHYTFGNLMFNPLYNAQLGHRNDSRAHFITNNLAIEWFASPNFLVRSRAMISRTIEDNDRYISPFNTQFIDQKDPMKKGSYTIGNTASSAFEGRLELQYSKQLQKHQINTSVIGEIRASNVTGNSYQLTGFIDDRFMTPQMALSYAENTLPRTKSDPVRELGVIGSFYYTYDNRYNFSLTGRADGASIYGPENRYSSFWSAGLSYNIHNEKWFRRDYINRLRLFANVGTNSSVSNFNAGMVNSGYEFISGLFYINQYATRHTSQGNSKLRWPDQKQYSYGTDISVFQDLLNLNANLYSRVTDRMISNITVAPSFGFPDNTYFANLGKVSNNGFEISANIRLMERESNQLSWFLTLGAVQNRSKLLEISNELRELNESLLGRDHNGNVIKPSTYFEEGKSLSIIRAVPSLGIDPATGREMFRTLNGDVTYTWNANDQVEVGNEEPLLYGNIGTSFNYKGFSLQVIGNYEFGGEKFNETLMNKIENNDIYVNADKRILEERWRKPGDISTFKSISDAKVTQISSRFIQREKYLRLSSININYNFGMKTLQHFKLQRLKLNFSMNDVLRLSNVAMERGISYPYAREYNLGVMIQF